MEWIRRVRDRLAFRSWYTDQTFREITKRLEQIKFYTERNAVYAQQRFVEDLLATERFRDPLRLERYGFKVYSQNDEDGIIAEVFRRIGAPHKTFVEFGAGNGLENNTLYLLLQGWRGLWLEGGTRSVASIRKTFSDVVETGQLSVEHAFVTKDNINALIGPFGETDFLSIDIDGNDYHIWEEIDVIRPRLVVIEHNAKFRPPISIVPPYVADRTWRGDDYMGASLEALVRLGKRKGYSLVGCNIMGLNAFFVRNDLVEDKFHAPFTAENHYHPPRYFLFPLYAAGHAPSWGAYVNVPEEQA